STEAMQGAVKSANIQTIYTSKKFLKKLEQRGINIVETFPETTILYLEDFKEEIPKSNMLLTLLAVMLLPTKLLQWMYLKPIDRNATAAILFSSGSEGTPKGIELSHLNLAINSRQIADVLNTRENDVVMSTLPTFHAFGLLATTFMPLSEGIPIVCHPDPTDVVVIAKAIARNEATFLFGTSTFLRLYSKNRRVHPLMLQSLRMVIAGAERLNPDSREAFKAKFHINILEGYGTTETSPVASVNIPDQLDTTYWKTQLGNTPGTVGMPVPGTSFRIVDPDTMEELATGEDGLILIGGPQVMKGYLNAPEKTAEVIVEMDGQRWYKSGDKGHLDENGFLVIVDRYSRFAKLGGEMISLTAVEDAIFKALKDPELELVAVNIPDEKKGEKVVLLISNDMKLRELKTILLEAGVSPMMLPANVINMEEVPKLGSGKTDFALAKKVVLAEDQQTTLKYRL
ncbi:MAG TPA: acyl-[ACP]--phospholipid O-acyltransferase, partial [Leucothrix mucor]|nr:acyl-[ACP]--phospholipid O-acyltransferase [Leucothrix mucor]